MSTSNRNKSKNSSSTFFGYKLYSSSSVDSKQPSKKAQNISPKTTTNNQNSNNIQLPLETKKSLTPEKIPQQTEISNNNNNNNLDDQNINKNDNMKVMVRVRPPLPREVQYGIPFRSICEIINNTTIVIMEYLGNKTNELEIQRQLINDSSLFQQHFFTFDHIFDSDSTQHEVYLKAAKNSVLSLIEGYNSTIFAYGQTGTGKTYTMGGGASVPQEEKRGIVPRVVENIFNFIEKKNYDESNKYIIRASYLQIYNESIDDLLKTERTNLSIREDKKKGIFIENLSEWVVNSSNDIYTLLQIGNDNRATASTSMNELSSRSHAIFIIILEQLNNNNIKLSKLNLVDLAGSERIKVTGATGKQLEESKKINKSLSALGNVINALTDTKGNNIHIPYRDSKLTRLLEDSLGGNCITTLITTISPSPNFINETLSSLVFAKRAKKIKNKPKINKDINHRSLISQYELQLRNLKDELNKKNELLLNNKLNVQLQNTIQEKNEIYKNLEEMSKKYYLERDAKKNLELKISKLENEKSKINEKNENTENNNVKIPENLEDTPEFKKFFEEKQEILIKEFENKLKQFEKDKNYSNNNNTSSTSRSAEEIERYKNLLLKHREMMSELTKKVNEKDENITLLQEENDIYQKINDQLQGYIINLNQNFKNLIDYCSSLSKDKKNLDNFLNIHQKINNEISAIKANNKIDTNNNSNININNTKKYF